MSEQQSPPDAVSTANSTDPVIKQAATQVIPQALQVRRAVWTEPAFLMSGVLAVLLLVQWWTSQGQISSLREEVARRLQSAETNSSETKILAKTVQDASKEIQAKVILLEGKQTEAQSQQLALEQLYQDLSKNRDEWALAEIEQVLSTASQQLQLAGNVQGALIALQNADSRLAKSEKPQFITIRRAIAKDIEKLKSLPTLDLTGIALRLDSVIAQVDHIPLWSDEKSVVTATPPKAPLRILPKSSAVTSNNGSKLPSDEIFENSWTMRIQDGWQSFSSEMMSELRQLMRVRNVETPDALLLTPSQGYFARENLKLRLLNARLALLSRTEGAFRSDMIAAQDAITKYFDTRTKQAQTVQALLRQVQGSNLSIEMPTLSDSLNAVRNYKVKP
ncbi:MAG: uroporphyrinogen-III C-methyltransferase [Undibacterium sp.]|uniref:uroporphyrinogen-III C-methyltransferase n=1 Tax=Undibacterium sp. TaxID=1914977 RepID=UPI002716A9B8|nr:uroporphyrinogen-III C-methyltransferase [Undibacterium sp.]MDO8652678.1 uroporphyrinogen-III C-methyltransferase [Undibacterium sp.]